MNPESPKIGFAELEILTRLHGYVAIVFNDYMSEEAIGYGPSTYAAMVQACGRREADQFAEVLNQGGRMTSWSAIDGKVATGVLLARIQNENGEDLIYLYK